MHVIYKAMQLCDLLAQTGRELSHRLDIVLQIKFWTFF